MADTETRGLRSSGPGSARSSWPEPWRSWRGKPRATPRRAALLRLPDLHELLRRLRDRRRRDRRAAADWAVADEVQPRLRERLGGAPRRHVVEVRPEQVAAAARLDLAAAAGAVHLAVARRDLAAEDLQDRLRAHVAPRVGALV